VQFHFEKLIRGEDYRSIGFSGVFFSARGQEVLKNRSKTREMIFFMVFTCR